jgi:hypothetical protein
MFHKSLGDLIRGARDVEEYAEALVRSAVSDAIHGISARYGLEERQIREEFLEDLVGKYAKAAGTSAKCEYITYRKKRCTRDATANGFCSLHAPPPPRAPATATGKTSRYIDDLLRITTTARD